MRDGVAVRFERPSSGLPKFFRLGWRQAGFVGLAYRLAHLRAPRTIVLGALSVVLFLA
jgi:hypothetical protein